MRMLFLDTIFLACMYFPHTCSGEVVQIGDAYIQGKHFTGEPRNPILTDALPGHQLKNEVNLQINSVVLDYFYWNNRVHSLTDQTQFRVVGWDFQIGLTLFQDLDVEYGHFSRHWLDVKQPYPFPVEDYIGFKFYFNRLAEPQNRKIIGGW